MISEQPQQRKRALAGNGLPGARGPVLSGLPVLSLRPTDSALESENEEPAGGDERGRGLEHLPA